MMTSLARGLKLGYTFDLEDARTTYRLQRGRTILAAAGLRPEVVHKGYERVEFGRPKHGCDYTCKTVWPEWATDEMFEEAARLANKIQTAQGDHNRAEAMALR